MCLDKVEPANFEQSVNESKIITSIFKSYDIRGKYPEQLDDLTARKIGSSIAQFLKEGNPKGEKRCRWRDMRLSSKSLTNALIDGICSTGMNVVNIGIVSTEMTTFAVGHYNYDGGVMVTASHNSAEYNGV